jgi:glycine C-acetyltransferase
LQTINFCQIDDAFTELHIGVEMKQIKDAGLFKTERIITSEQGAEITVNRKAGIKFLCGQTTLVYLPTLIEAAKKQ